MNKRIRKKQNNKNISYFNTRLILACVANDYILRSEEVKGKFPVRPIRYNIYLKKLKLHKRDTKLGSSVSKYAPF